MLPSYVERPPRAEPAGMVRTVWVQCSGNSSCLQPQLPTGGVEIHFRPVARRRWSAR